MSCPDVKRKNIGKGKSNICKWHVKCDSYFIKINSYVPQNVGLKHWGWVGFDLLIGWVHIQLFN